MKALMEYVGWRDVQSAMRYLDGRDPFARDRIEASLPSPTAPAPAVALPAPAVKSALQLLLRMVLTPFARAGRGAAKARGQVAQVAVGHVDLGIVAGQAQAQADQRPAGQGQH